MKASPSKPAGSEVGQVQIDFPAGGRAAVWISLAAGQVLLGQNHIPSSRRDSRSRPRGGPVQLVIRQDLLDVFQRQSHAPYARKFQSRMGSAFLIGSWSKPLSQYQPPS